MPNIPFKERKGITGGAAVPVSSTHDGGSGAEGGHPLTFQGKELIELISKCAAVEEKCLGSQPTENEDEFLKLKRDMYTLLFDTKTMFRGCYEVQQNQGNTVEVIKMQNAMEQNIAKLNTDFQKLKEAFKKQTKNRKDFSDEDLDTRFKEMQVIARQIQETKQLLRRGGELAEEKIQTLTDFQTQMEKAGIAPPPMFDGGGGKWREPTAEERAVMERWSERDKEFDRQIYQIGEVVERLGEIAVQIGDKAETQGKLILELSRQADEANSEVVQVNNKMKDLVSKGPGLNLICKLVLSLVFVGLVFFIVNNITNRFK